ncbi:hypothetical protein [Thermosyntropha sp.]|uniref:hypothetical protein n=1 Tax=Thermosyntropha sp. TaxID=2740820 RepID=UPI0025EAE810|nr:hypothetical protein [Thermosyntropha sp.]MBO8158843.1 hypothetical protein [Thermosyntropha sp.]
MIDISAIKPGDEIEYISLVTPRRREIKKGVVRQITGKLIAIDGENYPDTILINDLHSGQAKILKINFENFGEEEDNSMDRIDWDVLWPEVEKRLQEGQKIGEIAEAFKIDKNKLYCKIWREKQKAKSGNQHPEPELNSKLVESQENQESTRQAVLVEELEDKDDECNTCDDCGVVLKDGEDIFIEPGFYQVDRPKVVCAECFKKYPEKEKSYNATVAVTYDLDQIKLSLIELFLSNYKFRDLSAKDKLTLVGALKDMEVPGGIAK